MEPQIPKIRCLIVDDEPLAIKLVKTHVEKISSLELVATCKNALQAMDLLRRQNVDLMFLDIEMPEITGLEFLKTISHPPKVIFTTAYRQYAAEGFDLDVIDYLLKPISFERFIRAINRYFERVEKETRGTLPAGVIPHEERFIYIYDNKKTFKIYLRDILFIEGAGEYVKVHTTEKIFLSREPMHEMESKLPKGQFIRIHKSFIVSVSRITAFSAASIHIRNLELPIGRSYKDAVYKALSYRGN